jgi:hypothetical protein
MSKISAPEKWVDINVSNDVRNWTQDRDGTEYRKGNSAAPIVRLAKGMNHLLAKNPRTIFQKSIPAGDVDTSGLDPLYLWKYYDGIKNYRNYSIYMVCSPKTTDDVSCNAHLHGDESNTTRNYDYELSVDDLYKDCFEAIITVPRQDQSDAETEIGITTENGFRIFSISVQDDPIDELDTIDHFYCHQSEPRKGEKVLHGPTEMIRRHLHHVRTENLPIVVNWSSKGNALAPAAPGDETCITVSNTAYSNLIDQEVGTTRNTATPGIHYDANSCGFGPRDETAGKKVYVTFRVLCNTDSKMNIKFIGPDHIASNEVITATVSSTQAWVGADATNIALNPNVDYSCSNTHMNKIDVLAEVQTGGIGHIYGLRGWVIYED